MSYTTELNAINTMLSAVGSSPVNSLAAPLGAEVAIAQNILTETRREVLQRGWVFNTDYKLEIAVDSATNEVVVGENILRIDGSTGYNGNLDLVQRSGKLYDRTGHTHTITASKVTVDVTYILDWSDNPEVARRYMMIRAARVFADRLVGYNHQHQFTVQDEYQALADLREAEGATGDYSMLTGSWDVYRIVRRGSPLRDVGF
tara:strand:+ start:10042 stop:10650 length:609 start_codon:yes stop_codon:yes gene_type:complete